MLVVNVGRRHHRGMGQPALAIHANVELHTEEPLLAFAGLMHLGVTCLLFVLRRAGCTDDRGIHNGAGLQLHTVGLQDSANLGEQPFGKLMFLQQPTEFQQRGGVRHRLTAQVNSYEAAQAGAVILYAPSYRILVQDILPDFPEALQASAAALIENLPRLPAVADRRNPAGVDRRNPSTQNGPETRFRRVSRLRFFAVFGNRIFGRGGHRSRVALAGTFEHEPVGTMT